MICWGPNKVFSVDSMCKREVEAYRGSRMPEEGLDHWVGPDSAVPSGVCPSFCSVGQRKPVNVFQRETHHKPVFFITYKPSRRGRV